MGEQPSSPAHAANGDAIEGVLLRLLRERGWTVSTAESLTAGYVAGRLATVPGASASLVGGVVSYAPAVKHEVLGVPEGPVVTESAALSMARGVARLLRTDTAVATTGVAGPDPAEGQPVGTVCLAAITPDGERTTTVHLTGGREAIRLASTTAALDLLHQLIVHSVNSAASTRVAP